MGQPNPKDLFKWKCSFYTLYILAGAFTFGAIDSFLVWYQTQHINHINTGFIIEAIYYFCLMGVLGICAFFVHKKKSINALITALFILIINIIVNIIRNLQGHGQTSLYGTVISVVIQFIILYCLYVGIDAINQIKIAETTDS